MLKVQTTTHPHPPTHTQESASPVRLPPCPRSTVYVLAVIAMQPAAARDEVSLDRRDRYPQCDLALGYRFSDDEATPRASKHDLEIPEPYTDYDNWTCELCQEAGHDMHDLCCRKDLTHLSPLLRILHPQCKDLEWPYIHQVCTPQHAMGVGNNKREIWVERGFLCSNGDGQLHLREA